MRLVVTLPLGGVVELGLEGSDSAYPYLKSVGTMSESARAGNTIGIAATEIPHIEIEFVEPRKVSQLIGCPLRASAELFDDDDESFFAGTVSYVSYKAASGSIEVDA